MESIKKVIVYVVKDSRLLVFRHLDYPIEETGIQVPAGTVREAEDPRDAALRELREETGYDRYRIVSKLGESIYDMHAIKPEIHARHFFLAEPTEDLPQKWESSENHEGLKSATRLEFFWTLLSSPPELKAGQGAYLHMIQQRFKGPDTFST